MNLSGIINYIQTKLKGDQRLQSVFVDDVYTKWNHTNSSAQYMSAVLDYVSTSFNGDYADYTFIVYVANVVNEKQDNVYRSISIADSVIQQLLHKIDTEVNNMDLVIPNTITPFQQKFEDVLAGAYCQFTLRIPIEIICE